MRQRHTSESSRGDRKTWIKDRLQAITRMEIALRDDIDNDSSLDLARLKISNKSGGGKAKSESEPRQTSKQKEPQLGRGAVKKATKTPLKQSKNFTVIPQAVSDDVGASAPGVFHTAGQAGGPSLSATLPGQSSHQATHALLGNEPRYPISHNTLPFATQVVTGPVTTHPNFLTQPDPALVGDIYQPSSHAPTVVPWNNSGKLPERPTIMQAPSLPNRVEQWMFRGPTNELLCSTMLDPTCPLTMIPPKMLNGLGFDYSSKMMDNGIFWIPSGPVTVGSYTVTQYVMNLCILPSGGHAPIWFDAYVLPLPNYPGDRNTWTQRQLLDYESAWSQNHIIMGTTLHGLLAHCPRQSITASLGDD